MLRKICELSHKKVPLDIAPENFKNETSDSEETLRQLLENHSIEREVQAITTIKRVCKECNTVRQY